jgi:hypothetical protein
MDPKNPRLGSNRLSVGNTFSRKIKAEYQMTQFKGAVSLLHQLMTGEIRVNDLDLSVLQLRRILNE